MHNAESRVDNAMTCHNTRYDIHTYVQTLAKSGCGDSEKKEQDKETINNKITK